MKRLCLLLLLSFPALAQAAPPATGMVVAAEPQAAQAGVAMLEKGGNAFDAAAATALALGVVEPGSSGLGGGGFFLLYIAKQHRYVMIDARETSPQAAGHGEIYERQSSINGPQAAGVPGLAAGIGLLERKYGRLGLRQACAPAIRLARNGFAVRPRLAGMIRWRGKVLNDAARSVFLKKQGEIIREPKLAVTMERLASHGTADFYTGKTARQLVRDIRRAGGLISLHDLAAYHAVERKPVAFDYHGFRIVSAALPSSGGMTLAEIFGQLKNDDLGKMDVVDRDQLLIEAMKRAYRDRNRYLGDSDFVTIPRDYLDPARLAGLRRSIDMYHATPSRELGGVGEMHREAHNTTHFSIIDRDGNMVAATLSINYGFGSGYMSPSTGVLLNDEMDDFATRPGKPNVYGLVQGKANAVAPGKRMLSSMTPTFVIGPHRTFILGTPGGSRIISMVLEASVGFMLDKGSPQQWVDAPRFHHQFLPDEVQVEPDFPESVAAALAKRGQHIRRLKHAWGNMQAILWNRDSGGLTGIPDPRGEGQALATHP